MGSTLLNQTATKRWMAGTLSAVLAAGTLAAVPSGVSAASPPTADKAAPTPCLKNGGIAGFAMVNGRRISGATVTVFARPRAHGSETPWFTRPVVALEKATTNRMGGFFFSVDCLPPTFLVKVTGGKVAGRPFGGTVMSFGRANEPAVIVTAATTAAVRYSRRHPGLGVLKVVRKVTQDLGVVRLGNRVVALGQATWVDGVQPRTSGATPRSVASSTMSKLASNAAFAATCATLSPSAAGALACPVSSDDVSEITAALGEISQQLVSLQASVNEIQQTLSVMETQIKTIESQTNALIQDALKNEAQQAQQAYESASTYAGITNLNTFVQDASLALSVLGTIAPSADDTWPTLPYGSSNEQICDLVYGAYASDTGQDPVSECAENFLNQADAFADASDDRFAKFFTSMTGAEAIPNDDIFIWTYQDALTMAGNNPVSSDTVAGIQSQYAQIGELGSNAFALLAAAQVFQHGITRGGTTKCPDLTVSGTFSASTAISVATACDTLETGLFTAAVQDALAPSVQVPPDASVADPRNNYVWWAYPVDVTAESQTNDTFPFYPGSSRSDYSSDFGWPVGIAGLAQDAMLPPVPIDEFYPLIEADLEDKYWFADEQTIFNYFSNLPLTGGTLAQTMANSGFKGVGSSSNGVQWSNLGVDVQVRTNVKSDRVYQSNPSTQLDSSTLGCTGWPKSITGIFRCNNNGGTDRGWQWLSGVWATQSLDLSATTLPSSESLETCETAGTNMNDGSLQYFCWADTFGLLVSPTVLPPSGQGTGTTPPFWQPYMLAGPPSDGVPAIPIDPPNPS